MSDNSPIEWTDATWNPVTGCTKVSQGCKNCYAERVFPRAYGRQQVEADDPKASWRSRPREFTDVWTHPERLDQPLRWKKPRRIFVNSMSDLFHEDVPQEFLHKVFRVMVQARQHTFQVLTKRPRRAHDYLCGFKPDGDGWITPGGISAYQAPCNTGDDRWPLPNLWLGVSVEDQETANERIPLLLQTPAAVRFVSYEPALGPIDWKRWLGIWMEDGRFHSPGVATTLDWLIAGGESGPNARPTHPDWFRSARNQCAAAGVDFFFKQWGEWVSLCEVEGPGAHHYFPDGAGVRRTGKKLAGRLLDGHEHSEYPG